ncbi:MAG: hypothetical protein GTO24_21245 [candidate division Zixibacteria bacterium]|nr:hypothetical protein [candidate division Zixibacteria bacterium]
MTIFKPPDRTPYSKHKTGIWVFLAGSIEMGEAEKWQEKAGALFSAAGVTVLDPRRDDWDSTWIQSIENENFREQVEWELDALEGSDAIFVYFDPNTKSPITLLELGICSQRKSKKTFVCCPVGFWRRGNVEIICNRYGIFLSDSFEETAGALINYLVSMDLLT